MILALIIYQSDFLNRIKSTLQFLFFILTKKHSSADFNQRMNVFLYFFEL